MRQSVPPRPVGRTPQQIRAAYGIDSIELGSLVGDGTGQTIAILAVYDNPKLVSSTDTSFFSSDLHQFDMAFGLPDPPSFPQARSERRRELSRRRPPRVLGLSEAGKPRRLWMSNGRMPSRHRPTLS